jgi:RimJ/RimL family protein N-acetyltransferase
MEFRMNSTPIPEVETERLLLRGPSPDDLDVWAACYANMEVMRYLPKRILTPHARAERVSSFIGSLWAQDAAGGFGWVVARRADNRFIGLCHLEQIARANAAELSYLFDQPYWGQGFATEATRAAVRYGFEHSTWDRIVAATLPQNVASQRVLAHVGFIYEKDVNYYEFTGDTTTQLDSPMIPYFALARERFAPGNAFYRVKMAS